VECDIGMARPPVFEKMTIEDILKVTKNADTVPVTSAGFMVVVKPKEDGMVRRFRFENAAYTKARAIRGESNEIIVTLLTYMGDKDQTKMGEFMKFYPIYYPLYVYIYRHLEKMSVLLFQEYATRFIKHQFVCLPPAHHKFLGLLHAAYLRNRQLLTPTTVLGHLYLKENIELTKTFFNIGEGCAAANASVKKV
jgi:hypothetical protein